MTLKDIYLPQKHTCTFFSQIEMMILIELVKSQSSINMRIRGNFTWGNKVIKNILFHFFPFFFLNFLFFLISKWSDVRFLLTYLPTLSNCLRYLPTQKSDILYERSLMEYHVVECYCTCILYDFKIFFHLAKFDNFKDEKISDFKTVSVSQRKNLLDWKLVV